MRFLFFSSPLLFKKAIDCDDESAADRTVQLPDRKKNTDRVFILRLECKRVTRKEPMTAALFSQHEVQTDTENDEREFKLCIPFHKRCQTILSCGRDNAFDQSLQETEMDGIPSAPISLRLRWTLERGCGRHIEGRTRRRVGEQPGKASAVPVPVLSHRRLLLLLLLLLRDSHGPPHHPTLLR